MVTRMRGCPMLDFNEISGSPDASPHGREAERDEIRTALLGRMESILATMFPAGKKRRGNFLVGDCVGSPGDSLEVVLDGEKAGLWTDRATGDGGDIFDLIAAHLGANVQSDFARVMPVPLICSVGRTTHRFVRPNRRLPPTISGLPQPSGTTWTPLANSLLSSTATTLLASARSSGPGTRANAR